MNNQPDRNTRCVTCERPVNVVEQIGRSLSQIRWLTCDYCHKSCHLKCLVSDHCLPTTSAEEKQKLEREFAEETYVFICKLCRQESGNALVSQIIERFY